MKKNDDFLGLFAIVFFLKEIFLLGWEYQLSKYTQNQSFIWVLIISICGIAIIFWCITKIEKNPLSKLIYLVTVFSLLGLLWAGFSIYDPSFLHSEDEIRFRATFPKILKLDLMLFGAEAFCLYCLARHFLSRSEKSTR